MDGMPLVLKILTGGAVVAAAPPDARFPMAIDLGSQLLPGPISFPVAAVATLLQFSAIDEHVKALKVDLAQAKAAQMALADLLKASERRAALGRPLNQAEFDEFARFKDGGRVQQFAESLLLR